MKLPLCLMLLAVALGQPALAASTRDSAAATSNKAYLIDADRTFMEHAAAAGLAEVELSQAALRQSQNAEVRRYAEKMVKDHSEANKELMALASERNVKLPATVDDNHRKALEQLTRLSGAAFDKAFMNQMLVDHEKAVALFSQQAAAGKDDGLRSWSAKTLPHLQDHLNLARELRSTLK